MKHAEARFGPIVITKPGRQNGRSSNPPGKPDESSLDQDRSAGFAAGSAALCGNRAIDAADWDQRAGFGRRGFGEVGKFFGVGLQVLEETFELALHRVHLFAHVQNNFDAGEVHTKVARQRQNDFQTLEVGVRVKARVAFRARRLQEALTFVQTQGLRMQLKLFRHGADRVGFGALLHKSCSLSFELGTLIYPFLRSEFYRNRIPSQRNQRSKYKDQSSSYSNPIAILGFSVFICEYLRNNSFVSSEITFGKTTCTSTN